MAQNGGARKGAGRKPGAVAPAKRALAEMAMEYAPDALKTLAYICVSGEAESARVSAANAILDRAYGRPPQSLEHTGLNGGPIQHQEMSAREALADRIANLAARSGTGEGAGKPH